MHEKTFFAYFERAVPKKEQIMSFHTKPVVIPPNKRIMGTGIAPQRRKAENAESEERREYVKENIW